MNSPIMLNEFGESMKIVVKEEDEEPLSLLDLPTSVLLKILRYLRYSEARNFRSSCPYPWIYKICKELNTSYAKEIHLRNDFRWIRSIDATATDQMASRLGHSLVYHQKGNAVYVFGGKAVDPFGTNDYPTLSDLDEHACFNDLWKIDLATMQSTRVIVRSTPYPSPKFNAVMVLYKDELLLFGGHRPVPQTHAFRPIPNTNEVHLFNTKQCTWRTLITLNDGPCLAGHCGIICGDYLIVYGGHLTPYEYNTTIRVLDIKSRRWFKPVLPNVPDSVHVSHNYHDLINMDFPAYVCGSNSLIALSENSVLLLGELKQTVFTKNWAVIFTFDKDEIEEKPWSWRKIEVTGKWWEERSADDEQNLVRSRNCPYSSVVALRTDKMIRLVSVGFPKNTDAVTSTKLAQLYEIRQKRLRAFVEYVVKLVSTEMKRRDAAYRHCIEDDYVNETKFEIVHDGIQCTIEGCFLNREEIQSCKKSERDRKPKTADNIVVSITIQPDHPSQISSDLDDADKFDIMNSIKQRVSQLHMHHYTSQILIRSSPSQSRFLPKSRLVAYTAVIPMDPCWTPNSVQEIVFAPCRSDFRSPSATSKYALCAGKAEVIMHGGAFGNAQNGTMRMGFTYLLTPADKQKEDQTAFQFKL